MRLFSAVNVWRATLVLTAAAAVLSVLETFYFSTSEIVTAIWAAVAVTASAFGITSVALLFRRHRDLYVMALAVWVAGRPGTSSTFEENGGAASWCFVVFSFALTLGFLRILYLALKRSAGNAPSASGSAQ